MKVATVIENSNSPREHAKAQFKLMRLAKKACKGKGTAVSEGTLNVDNVVLEGKSKPVLVISEYYRCSSR